MRLIAGLGNPGKEYEYTRHNLGFMVVRRLAEKLKFKWTASSLTKAMAAEGTFGGEDICLLAPLTYMNNSGIPVRQLMTKKEISSDELLVVCDDFNLDFGQIRLRAKGSDGGHNGLSSVIERLDTELFARLRMGIGYPLGKTDLVDYVLEEFTEDEKERLNGFVEEAVSCCFAWIQQGIDEAMDQFNRRKQD